MSKSTKKAIKSGKVGLSQCNLWLKQGLISESEYITYTHAILLSYQ